MKKNFNKERGFTLVELLISMAIFSIIMIAIAGIFGNAVGSYNAAKEIQENLEDAQFAMNLISKTLRTSSIVQADGASGVSGGVATDIVDGSVTDLTVLDYSQGNCVRFVFDSGTNRLMTGESAAGTNGTSEERMATCLGAVSDGNLEPLVGGRVRGSFDVTSSMSGRTGKVSMFFRICEDDTCLTSGEHETFVQSSVSLRDYGVSGF